MFVLRAYRFRLYPSREQQTLLDKTFGCKRFIWNKMLEEREAWYEQHGTSHAREDRVRPATVQALVVEPGIPRL